MSPTALYQQLVRHVRTQCPTLRAWSVPRLAVLVTGLILARHVSLPRIAAALGRIQPHTRTASVERRLRRTLADRHLTAASAFVPLARFSLRRLPGGRCLVILDDTTQTTHAHLTTLALAYRGRALPLAWVRWTGPLHGTYWEQVATCIAQAQAILPPQVRPCLLADRGLACPRLAKLARAAGWDYLLRVQRTTRIQLPTGQRVALAALAPDPGTAFAVTGQFRRPWQQADVQGAVGCWTPGQAAPWLLVTNLPLTLALLPLYRRRMHIEALFRDAKSGGFIWEASRVHDPDHAARLLLALMVAVFVAVRLGERALHRQPPQDAARSPAISVLRRGLDLLCAPPRIARTTWTFHPPPLPVRI